MRNHRAVDAEKLLAQIGAEIHQLQNQLRAIPRSDHSRKQEQELLQERIDDKDFARRMLQDELQMLNGS